MSVPVTDTERVLIAVALYGMMPAASETVQGLAAAMKANARLRSGYALLLWDNSPPAFNEASGAAMPDLGIEHYFERAPVNDGVAGAFNEAAVYCDRHGYKWMLLLDQDTRVTADFLLGMLRYPAGVGQDKRIAAVVPVLREGATQLSPKRVLRFRDVPVAAQPARLLEGETFAANSGVLMRVAALQAIGGYSTDFWLDHSDMYVFHHFHQRGMRVFLAADLVLQHSMTMQDYDGRMTPRRYENFLYAEQAFLDLYKDPIQHAVHIVRMLARVVRQRRYRDRIYSKMTWAFLLRRIRTRKTERLRGWKQRRQARVVESGKIGAGE